MTRQSSDPRVVEAWISEHGGIVAMPNVANEYVVYALADGATLTHWVENDARRHGWELSAQA